MKWPLVRMILRVIQASCLPHTDNAPAFSSHVTDDIAGDRILHGKKEFIAALPEISSRELRVGKSITHGPDASANGYMILKNGSTYDFCDVLRI